MQLQIWAAIRSAPYYDDTRISYGSMHVAGQSNAPYLRIWTTSKRERDDIVRRLAPLDIRIELPPLLDRVIKPRSSIYKETGRNMAAVPSSRLAQDRPIFKDRIE
jgi:hypothetical protein